MILVYLITNRLRFLRSPEITQEDLERFQLEAIAKAAQAGCQLIQIREKDMSSRKLGAFTRAALEFARPHGARVLINDRFDIAIAAGADGVHLRASSISVREVRAAVRKKGLNDFLIGVSTHSIAEAKLADEGGADFIVCGPVYDTPSKRDFGPPLGLDRFAEVCGAVKISTLALGGVNLSNFRETLKYGASGVAAISMFADLENIEQTIGAILSAQPKR